MQIADESLSNPLDKQMIMFLRDEIEELLIVRFGYVAKDLPSNFHGRLTDKGKEAKEAGGHFK